MAVDDKQRGRHMRAKERAGDRAQGRTGVVGSLRSRHFGKRVSK